MERIFNLISLTETKCTAMIGEKSLERLAPFILGYEEAIYQLLGAELRFTLRFQIFVEYREEKQHCVMSWDRILLKNYSEDEAFIKFFEYVDEFKEWIKNPENEAIAEAELEKELQGI